MPYGKGVAGLQDSPGCNLGQLLLRTACDVELLCFPLQAYGIPS